MFLQLQFASVACGTALCEDVGPLLSSQTLGAAEQAAFLFQGHGEAQSTRAVLAPECDLQTFVTAQFDLDQSAKNEFPLLPAWPAKVRFLELRRPEVSASAG